MKPAAPDNCDGVTRLRALLALFLCASLPFLAFAAAPAWWAERGVTVPNASADDYAPANQGQLKNIAKAAVAEMDAKLPGGAGQALHELAGGWSNPSSHPNDFAPINLGQLKTVAKPFYDRLIAVKYVETYPWISSGAVPEDFAAVNIGQIKNLFSCDFVATDPSHDTDGNGLPDWWENYYFGTIGIDPNALAPRGDGLTNLEAFQQQLDPINDGQIVAINPERIDETVPTGQTVTRTISVTNTASISRQLAFSPHSATAIVNYSYTDSDQEGGPEFVWNDISVTGVHLDNVSDADNGFEGFPISFSFPYYGAGYTTVYVASDGYVTFGGGSTHWWGGAMPDINSPAAMIAAFEDDLDLGASGDVYYQDYGDRVVIQFENAVRYYGDGYVTFQIVLNRDGTVVFYYKDMQGTVDGAVVGIQNLATNQGITIAYYEPYLKSDLAIRIVPWSEWQPAPWLQVSPATMSLAPGASAELSVTLDGRMLAPGLFSGGITISSDDPSATPREIPVTMTLVDDEQLDNDNDGLTNGQERALGTDPNKIDTDGDGMPDGWEVAHGLNPLVNDASGDPDGDGVSNLEEYRRHSDPFDFFEGARPFLDIVSGNNQFGDPGTFAALPLTVRVRKSDGQPYGNARVVFTVPSGTGQLASATPPVVLQGNEMTVHTDADGLARVGFLFADVPGNSSRVTAGTGAFERWVTADFRAVSTYHPPAGPTPSPGPSPSPTASPTATPAPPYRYALIDLGKDTFPDRVNKKGWVLMSDHNDSIRWKAGVAEVLTTSRPSDPFITWDMNDEGTVVGTGGQWWTDESPNPNYSGNKEVSWGLVWPPDSTVPTEIRGPVAPHWAPTLTGKTIQQAYLRAISNPPTGGGSADLYGGAYEGSAYKVGSYGVTYKDILNAYRWSGSGGSPAPLSFSSSIPTDANGSWVFDWQGPVDNVTRTNSSRHYIGTQTTPGPRVGEVNTSSTSGMIDGQSVNFFPTDINEAGIVVAYSGSTMVIKTPGAADQTIIGRSNLYPVAVNDHIGTASPQSSASPSPSATPMAAPQILASDGNVNLLWERQPDGTTWHPFSLEEMIPNMDGWWIDYVTDMNDSGVIIGRGSYKDPANPQADWEGHGFMLVPVDVQKVWSDQLPGVTDANYLPNKTGQGDRAYLLMGAAQSNNFDLKGHLKAKVNVPTAPELRDKILWRLAGKSGNTYTSENGMSTYNAAGDEVTVVLDNPRTDEQNSYFLVAGYDRDGNGQLASSEINFEPKYQWRHRVNGQIVIEDHDYEVKIVARSTYDQSRQTLTDLSNTWDSAGLSQASRLLTAFLTEAPPTGATSQPAPIARDEQGLTHAVGVLFQPPGNPGVSLSAQFSPASQMTATLLESESLNNWVSDQFETKRQEVDQRFRGTTNAVETFIWQFTGDLSFSVISDPDLFFALGKTTIAVRVEVEVNRALYEVQATALTGSVMDLTDFDYDDGSGYAGYGDFVRDGARVQAGYNTLGIGGRVFKNNVQMFNSPISVQFRFQ